MSTAERLEQLRDLPRVTVADRERYKRWEQESRAELAEVEPTSTRLERAYLQAAMLRKLWLVLHRPGEGDVPITRAEWHSHWRSLPDYDGPPMRAPSGPVFELFDCSGTPAQEFSAITNVYLRERISDAQAQAYAELLQHFAAMARRGECEFVGFGLLDMTPKDAYEHPSVGGRGWCPKLAGGERMSTIRETIRVHVARIRCDRCGRVASPSYHGEECSRGKTAGGTAR